jgi:hypothetical protein
MDIAKVPKDALERVVEGPRAFDAGVHDEDREHVLVSQDVPPPSVLGFSIA